MDNELVELGKRSRIDQYLDALARRSLSALMLFLDRRLAGGFVR
jgi:hypothetical protein